MNSLIGRGVALGGLGFAVAGTSIDEYNGEAFWGDGTSAGLLVALIAAAAVALAVGTIRRAPGLYLVAGAVGMVIWGWFLFDPTTVAFNQWSYLDTGAYLGLCTGLIALGALLAYRAETTRATTAPEPARRSGRLGRVVVAAGIAILFVSIWLDVFLGLSYWELGIGNDHQLGLFLVLAIYGSVSLLVAGAAFGGLELDLAVAALGFLTLGFVLVLPIFNAFGHLDRLRAGAWVAVVGSVLFAGGASLNVRQSLITRGAAPAISAAKTDVLQSILAGFLFGALGLLIVAAAIVIDPHHWWPNLYIPFALAGLFLVGRGLYFLLRRRAPIRWG